MKKEIASISIPPQTVEASAALKAFFAPDLDARPMSRMWFPDAGAGERDDDCVEAQLRSMAEGGIGGVEVALLGDDTGNLDGENYGWGSPNWVKTMKKVLRAAEKIEGGFKVDFTITAHWPPIVNTIDPNDGAASSNMVFTWKKLRPEDAAVTLPLPETVLYDSGANPFIFKDTFCGAVVGTVADLPVPRAQAGGMPFMDQNGLHHFGPDRTMNEGKAAPQGGGFGFPPMGEEKPKAPFVLKLDSLQNVTSRCAAVTGAGYACGIPDGPALEKWYGGKLTEADVAAVFGPPADESRLLPDGKRDRELNCRRMADFQELWQLDASDLCQAASAGSEPAPGDKVVICCYYRGTGQIFSGGFKSRLMKNMTYAANYFTVAGTRAITGYWDDYILSDGELRALMEKNAAKVGGSIFEDSIELHSNGANWGLGFYEDVAARMGCDPAACFPVILGLYFDDREKAARILEEYKQAIGGMYQDNHIGFLNRWASRFGYSYRAQAGMAGINVIGANTATGITEGDNGTFKDANRRLAGCVNMVPEKKFHSFESNTFTGLPFAWPLLVQECHYDASTGTNRIIFHGTAYCKNVHNFYDWWPGWNWGGGGGKAYDFMAWDKRVCWWDDARAVTDYLSRLCGVLQNAQAKVEAAVLWGSGETIMNGEPAYSLLTDRGYTYNILGDYSLTLPAAGVTNGVLFETGPAYRCLIVKDASSLLYKTAEIILGFAQSGLPVIFDGRLPERVFGLEKLGAGDPALQAVMAKLKSLKNVYFTQSEEALLLLLTAIGITPAASYNRKLLEATHLKDAVGDYYAFYNDTLETVRVPVTLCGNGVPALLDCWSGEAEAVADAITKNGGVSFTLELAPQDMKFFALVPEAAAGTAVTAESAEPIEITVSRLELESFGPPLPGDPEYDPGCPINSHRETVVFENVSMGALWEDLPASEAQLEKLRVSKMADVSGRSSYTMSFELPKGVKAVDVTYSHNEWDFVVGGELDGLPLPPPNCMENGFTIRKGLKPGKNTLKLRLDSTMTNRLNFESPANIASNDLSLMSFGGGPRDYSIRKPVGITKVHVQPYV